MSGPITDYELGKMLHREYEAQFSQSWGQNVIRDDKSSTPKQYKLALALSSVTLTALLIVRLFAF